MERKISILNVARKYFFEYLHLIDQLMYFKIDQYF